MDWYLDRRSRLIPRLLVEIQGTSGDLVVSPSIFLTPSIPKRWTSLLGRFSNITLFGVFLDRKDEKFFWLVLESIFSNPDFPTNDSSLTINPWIWVSSEYYNSVSNVSSNSRTVRDRFGKCLYEGIEDPGEFVVYGSSCRGQVRTPLPVSFFFSNRSFHSSRLDRDWSVLTWYWSFYWKTSLRQTHEGLVWLPTLLKECYLSGVPLGLGPTEDDLPSSNVKEDRSVTVRVPSLSLRGSSETVDGTLWTRSVNRRPISQYLTF